MSNIKSVLHRADSRGHADFGWLNSYHSFSFGRFYDPERINFGALRVLNDDVVAPGKGFGMHRHDNMEIVSIPLEGDLEHKDSMGNTTVIKEGDIQVMSAGTGIFHSEYNKNADKPVKFLQIWIVPNKDNVLPRYDQISLNPDDLKNTFYQILSPSAEDEGVWVHQKAWFHMGHMGKDQKETYHLKNADNGLYVFIIDGMVQIGDNKLGKRDALGIWNESQVEFTFDKPSKVLLMEVPRI